MLNIIICTYNPGQQLRGCLNSISSQKTSDLKLYIFDGGSTDDSIAIINEYSGTVDTYLSQTDSGVYDAMNKVSNLISHGFILFLGADDRLMPGAVDKISSELNLLKSENVMIYGDVYRPCKNILYDGSFTLKKLIKKNICQQAIIYPCSAFSKYKFNLDYPINADHLFNISIFCDNTFIKKYIPVCISYYEDINDGISRNKSDENLLNEIKSLCLYKKKYMEYLYASILDIKRNFFNR